MYVQCSCRPWHSEEASFDDAAVWVPETKATSADPLSAPKMLILPTQLYLGSPKSQQGLARSGWPVGMSGN